MGECPQNTGTKKYIYKLKQKRAKWEETKITNIKTKMKFRRQLARLNQSVEVTPKEIKNGSRYGL